MCFWLNNPVYIAEHRLPCIDVASDTLRGWHRCHEYGYVSHRPELLVFTLFWCRTQMSTCPICTGLCFFKKSWRLFSVFNIKAESVGDSGWIFHSVFTQRNKDTRHVQAPHKYMQKCFFYEFTSKCIKVPLSIIWKCIFLNYSSRGSEAPRSCEFFISAQLQTVDLVKGTQF